VRRPGQNPAILFAFVLVVQTVLAPAHCLVHAIASGFETIICTPDGTRVVHLTADGEPAPQEHAKPASCAICHSLPAAPVFAVPALPRPAWTMVAITWRTAAQHSLLPAARAPPFRATGPPISL
jgi:hypothetical protein